MALPFRWLDRRGPDPGLGFPGRTPDEGASLPGRAPAHPPQLPLLVHAVTQWRSLHHGHVDSTRGPPCRVTESEHTSWAGTTRPSRSREVPSRGAGPTAREAQLPAGEEQRNRTQTVTGTDTSNSTAAVTAAAEGRPALQTRGAALSFRKAIQSAVLRMCWLFSETHLINLSVSSP